MCLVVSEFVVCCRQAKYWIVGVVIVGVAKCPLYRIARCQLFRGCFTIGVYTTYVDISQVYTMYMAARIFV